jgi:hypothetical protein
MKLKIHYIIILLIILSSCSTSKDKFNALNDYLNIELKDSTKRMVINKTKGIIIVEEKISPNYTIEKFDECVLSAYHLGYQFRGDTTLYNVKNWTKMKNKYALKQSNKERFYLKNDFWTKQDFTFKRITIEKIEKIKNVINDPTKDSILNSQIYAFSEPIYYKNKKFIVLSVSNFTYSSIPNASSYLVIMKKEKGKWVVLNYVVNEW